MVVIEWMRTNLGKKREGSGPHKLNEDRFG